MARQIKGSAKLLVLGLLIAGLFYGGSVAVKHGWGQKIAHALVPTKAGLPDVKDRELPDVTPIAMATTTANGCQDPIRNEVWAWNSQMGWIGSNGGIDTTKGSLAEKYGVCQHFNRQDDTSIMKTDLLACAKDLANSTECSSGVHTITIMGDGAGQFLAQYNAEAKKICADCTAEWFGTSGFSRGEDGLWGPASWKSNPKSMLGDGLIIGVLRDGDWNTALKYIGGFDMKNNPDESTFDEDAVNWVNADNYLDAPQKFISGYCVDRKVIKNGHLTGEIRNVCVKGFVTWTPGDVNAATQKGGVVPIVTTREYRSQMPSAIIGIKKWDRAHGDKLAAMLAAALANGAQVRAFPDALNRAGDASAEVYCAGAADNCKASEQKQGSYWVKYYKGVVEPDAQGHKVALGGSFADSMNDALQVFGLIPGSNNNAKATYDVFSKIVLQQYPDLFKDTPIPPSSQAINTAYLWQAKTIVEEGGPAADVQKYSATAGTGTQLGDKSYHIEFPTGSATLTSQGLEVVKQIKDDTAITGLTITLEGHTDNTGNQLSNVSLSSARAAAVERKLQELAPNDFPSERFRVHGYGQSKPIADNSTTDGRSQNRRVQVKLTE